MRKTLNAIKFVENKYRRDKGKPSQEPIKCSKYAKQLFKIGAGWNGNKQTTHS